MTELNEILNTLINPEAHINFDETNESIKIEEPQNTKPTQLRSVQIEGIEKCFLAFKLDHEKHKFLSTLINDVTDIKKACDAIIFCEVNNQKYVFLVEMKSDDAKGVTEKIKSTKAFLAFLSSLLNSYYQIDLQEFKEIAILFDTKKTEGRPVLNDKKGVKYYHQGFKRQDNTTPIDAFTRLYGQ